MVSEINRRYVAEVAGFDCVGTAANAEQAMSCMQEQHVDLVLLDIFMPGRSGLNLLAEIRAANQSVDVIMITAASDMKSIQTGMRLGAVDYLIKPFEFERLSAALKAYQREHRLLHEQQTLSQSDVDHLFHAAEDFTDGATLPKGLTRETLQKTIGCIRKRDMAAFSTEMLAQEVGISRISMRKYLSFLVHIGYVIDDLSYGTIGRPTIIYRRNPEKSHDVIAKYM